MIHSFYHTHTHTHMHARTYPHTHTHACARTHAHTHTHTHTKYKWYHAKEGLTEGRYVLFLLFRYSHLPIHTIHSGKRSTLTWVVNLVQQLDGASGHHAAQAHDKAGREGTHGEERKLLHEKGREKKNCTKSTVQSWRAPHCTTHKPE